MIPISLSIAGFLSYKEPVEIDFNPFDLACIAGRNGAGKSSILDAMTWALFGRARKHDESVINNQSDKAVVNFVFSYEGNTYRVTRINPRGDTKLVEFHIRQEGEDGDDPRWKPLTERTLRETDQRIEDVLRLDYETFINAAFFLQGEADQFTKLSPSDRKRILSRILGLEVWETYRKQTFQKRKEVESEINRLDGRLTEITQELEEEDARKERLAQLQSDLERAVKARQTQEANLENILAIEASLKEQTKFVDSLARQVSKGENKLNQLQVRLHNREEEKDALIEVINQAEEIEEAYQDWQKAKEDLTTWEKIAEEFREQEKLRQGPLTEIAAEKARLNQELHSLQEEHRKLQSKLKAVPGLKKELQDLEVEIAAAEGKLEKRDQLKEELEGARQKQAEAKAENPRLMEEMKELKKRIGELDEAEGVVCPLCGQDLSAAEREELIQHLEKEGKELGDRFRENRALLSKADQIVKDLRLQITQLSTLDKDLRERTQEADRIRNRLEQIQAQKEEWEAERAPRMENIASLLEEERFAPQARKKLAEVNATLKEIGYDAGEHDRIRKTVERGAAIQDRRGELEKARAALSPLEREIEELAAQIAAEEEELEEQKSELEEAQASLQAAKAEAPDKEEAEKELLALKERENVLQREVGAAQQKVNVLEKQKVRQAELEERREGLRHRVSQYKQLEEAFGKNGVPALLIEQALPHIESKANQLLERLSEGGMSVRFLTQREYKDTSREDLKETLEIQIQDRAGARDYEMYSGGESFRVNFAIRLALSHILAQRAGARLQTLVIDEGFGSQDALGRQRLIEAINLIRDDFKKILVITHIEEMKDKFSTQLLVEKTPQGSQVTMI
jgi:exonuclease SbcC